MLKIKVIMNTSMEAVLDFKCCHLAGQNCEFHVTNAGRETLVVPSHCDLEGEGGVERIPNLYPPGEHPLRPGETLAFYCSLDERLLARCRRIIFYDQSGRRYPSILEPGRELEK